VRRIAAVAKNTFREAARNKILYSLLFFAVALILSALALGELSVHEERRMIRDVGLFGVDLFSVLIAIFVGVNLLYKELALKTVYTILPKPIARWEFVLGKWLGVMATLVAQIGVMGAVLALTLWVKGDRCGWC
jgi:Cu-processing system permease protein